MTTTAISNMTVSLTLPSGAYAPFIVTDPSTGLNTLSNYRFDFGAALSQLWPHLNITASTGGGGATNGTTAGILTTGDGATDIGLEIFKTNTSLNGIRLWTANGGHSFDFMDDGSSGGVAGSPTYFGNNGAYYSAAYIVVSGTYVDNGFNPVTDRRYVRTIYPASSTYPNTSNLAGRPAMLSIWADVETGAEFRAAQSDGSPEQDYAMLAFLDELTGIEIGCLDRNAMLRFGPGTRELHDTSFGRVNANTMGMAVGAMRPGAVYTNTTSPSGADIAIGAVVYLTNGGDGAGLYMSDGARLYKLTLGTTASGPAPTGFGWTTETKLFSGGQTITASGTKSFAFSATDIDNAWVATVYSNETLTANKQIDFYAGSVSKLMAVGINSGSAPTDVSGGDVLKIKKGVILNGTLVQLCDNGVLGNIVGSYTVGTKISVRQIGTTIAILIDDVQVDASLTASASTAYWVECAFHQLAGAVTTLRYRNI